MTKNITSKIAQIDQYLKKLSSWKNHQKRAVAAQANKVYNYAKEVQEGKITVNEMQELLGDLSDIKKQAQFADEIVAIQQINKITNQIIDVLKKAVM